ncbi:hypothetical protein [Paenibacillus protaetiae]|uniref:hypothetical protein n=1 Tax=Paenibacillus protaetiae TaxID=2509456 RepID=UPI0013EC9D09|nr:hypothetical protein [Paenibacillus protaetiae]
MDKDFFNEMRKISHNDDMRSRLLIHGIKRILEEKQEEPKLRRLFRRKKKIVARGWDD